MRRSPLSLLNEKLDGMCPSPPRKINCWGCTGISGCAGYLCLPGFRVYQGVCSEVRTRRGVPGVPRLVIVLDDKTSE